jgi:hypothetical protein
MYGFTSILKVPTEASHSAAILPVDHFANCSIENSSTGFLSKLCCLNLLLGSNGVRNQNDDEPY